MLPTKRVCEKFQLSIFSTKCIFFSTTGEIYVDGDIAQAAIDNLNLNLLLRLNATRKIHLVPSVLNGNFLVRMSINWRYSNIDHIKIAWKMVQDNFVTEVDNSVIDRDAGGRSASSPSSEMHSIMSYSSLTFLTPDNYQLLKDNRLLRSDPYGYTPIPYTSETSKM